MTEADQSLEVSPLSFNLIDEPWLPVLDLDGNERDISLREALCSAHLFRDVAAELPTMRFAILRIMFAVMYRVLDRVPTEDPEADWAELWREPELPATEFDAYFEKWHDRFDLFDATQPFMQTPDLRTAKDQWRPVSLIVADADPNGALFTMRSELDSLSFAEAARWLLHTHAYDYSGIKTGAVGDSRVNSGRGKPMGIGFSGWLGGVALRGDTLRETLLLNLIRNRTTEMRLDAPIWEHAPLSPGERSVDEIGKIGPLALLTWPQRRVRLRAEQGRVNGVLVTNGDPVDYTMQSSTELYTGWRFSEPQSQKAKTARYMPQQLHTGRALWQGLSTLLPTPQSVMPKDQLKNKWKIAAMAQPAAVVTWMGDLTKRGLVDVDHVIEIVSVSMEYGTQNASYQAVASDQLALSPALTDLSSQGLIEVAHDAVEKAHGAVRALSDLVRDLNRAVGGEDPDAGQLAMEDAYASLDISFRRWLLKVRPGRDAQLLLRDWTEAVRTDMRARAEQLIEAAPASAWAGRVASSGVMGPRTYSVATAMRSFESALVRVLGMSPQAKNHNRGTTEETAANSVPTTEEA